MASPSRPRESVWDYPRPPRVEPGRVDGAFLDDERVTPQAGNFYGGWITAEIEGPFKGESGTEGW